MCIIFHVLLLHQLGLCVATHYQWWLIVEKKNWLCENQIPYKWKYWITLHVTCIEFDSNTLSLCSCAGVFLCWPSLRCPQIKTSHQFKFLLVTFRFETFDRSMSHLGIFFDDVDQTTLLLNNHTKLNAQETLKMLNLFGLKIMFAMKIKFIFKF